MPPHWDFALCSCLMIPIYIKSASPQLRSTIDQIEPNIGLPLRMVPFRHESVFVSGCTLTCGRSKVGLKREVREILREKKVGQCVFLLDSLFALSPVKAIDRGVGFELIYSPAIKDSTMRRYTISNALNLMQVCKGKVWFPNFKMLFKSSSLFLLLIYWNCLTASFSLKQKVLKAGKQILPCQ